MALTAAAAALVWILGTPPAPPVAPPTPDPVAWLGDEPPGFAVPDGPWVPSLPADLGPHPEVRAEVWGISGRLADGRGRVHGFQLNLARLALLPDPPRRATEWAANRLVRGHFTLASAGAERALVAERLGREALGIAGARGDPPRVWVKDWSLAASDDGRGGWRLHLQANAPEAALTLDLEPRSPAVSDRQLALSTQTAGGAGLRLFAVAALAAHGRLALQDQSLEVQGTVYLERAWGSVPTLQSGSTGQLAVNRFGLRLDDGRVLLCLDLRRLDGSGTPIPSCTLIDDTRIQRFQRREIVLEPRDVWQSPRTGARYAVSWRLAIAPLDLDLTLAPLIADQELDLALRQWNGEVQIAGRQHGTDLGGSGRIELTPLADR